MQDPEAFCFGIDAVELANFVPPSSRLKPRRACDLGSGNGIVSVLLAAKKHYGVTAVEIQAAAAELCHRNAELNGLSNQMTTVCAAMQDFAREPLNRAAFDITVCNPPYEPKSIGKPSESEPVRIARFEECVTLGEVIECAAMLTKFGGKFYTVHKTCRLSEVLSLCTQSRLEPKVLQILRPAPIKPPHLFLLSCTKNGKPGLRLLPERTVGKYI